MERAIARAARRPLLPAICLYLLAVALLYPAFGYRVDPDATAYFSLAHKWAQGDWLQAITGHWPPLLIWMIALGLKAGLNVFMAIAASSALAGCLLLWSVHKLAVKPTHGPVLPWALLGTVSFYAIFYTFAMTPDLLLAALLTCYLALCAEPRPPAGTLWIIGMVAGLAYLAKPVALYFVLFHYALSCLVDNWREHQPWPAVFRRIGIVTVMMLLVAAPWVGCLWVKYHRFTFSTGGDFFFRALAPAFHDAGIVNVGLAAPPNSTAYNYWEDPGRLNLPPWSPLESRESFRYFLGYFRANIVQFALLMEIFSIAAFPILGYALFRWRPGRSDRGVTVLACAALLLSGAYCVFVPAPRYVFVIALWLLLLAVGYFPESNRSKSQLCFSFLPVMLYSLAVGFGAGQPARDVGRKLPSVLAPNSRVASLSAREFMRSLNVSYWAGLRYYGATAPGSADDVRRELARYDIQYVLVWANEIPAPHLLDGMRKLESPVPALRIYAIAEDRIGSVRNLERERN